MSSHTEFQLHSMSKNIDTDPITKNIRYLYYTPQNHSAVTA